MPTLDTTVAVYDDLPSAERDWDALELGIEHHQLEIADAAMVENQHGDAIILARQSHHGWGKGAIVGAVVGILFPPSIIGAAAVGAGGGALIARMTRSLGRGKVKDLGETLDSGTFAIIVISPEQSTKSVGGILTGARTRSTVPSASSEDVQQAMS